MAASEICCRQTVQGEVHGIRGDQTQGDALKFSRRGDVIHTVNVTEIARWIAIGVERVHKGAANEIQPHGREVQKHRHGRERTVCGGVLLPQGDGTIQGKLEPYDLSVHDLFVVHRTHGDLLLFVQKPAAGPAYDLVFHEVGIIVEELDGGNAVFPKENGIIVSRLQTLSLYFHCRC